MIHVRIARECPGQAEACPTRADARDLPRAKRNRRIGSGCAWARGGQASACPGELTVTDSPLRVNHPAETRRSTGSWRAASVRSISAAEGGRRRWRGDPALRVAGAAGLRLRACALQRADPATGELRAGTVARSL